MSAITRIGGEPCGNRWPGGCLKTKWLHLVRLKYPAQVLMDPSPRLMKQIGEPVRCDVTFSFTLHGWLTFKDRVCWEVPEDGYYAIFATERKRDSLCKALFYWGSIRADAGAFILLHTTGMEVLRERPA